GIAEDPARADGGQCADPVHLAIALAVRRQLGGDDVPRFLRDDQDADAQLRHDAARLGGHRGSICAALEGSERSGPDWLPRLADELARILRIARLERPEQHLRALHEAGARLLHRDAEALELHAPEPPPDAEDEPPA